MSDFRQRIKTKSQFPIIQDLIERNISTCCLLIDSNGLAKCSQYSAPFMDFKEICKKCREDLMK